MHCTVLCLAVVFSLSHSFVCVDGHTCSFRVGALRVVALFQRLHDTRVFPKESDHTSATDTASHLGCLRSWVPSLLLSPRRGNVCTEPRHQHRHFGRFCKMRQLALLLVRGVTRTEQSALWPRLLAPLLGSFGHLAVDTSCLGFLGSAHTQLWNSHEDDFCSKSV